MAIHQTTISIRPLAAERIGSRASLQIAGFLLFLVGAAFLIVTMLAASMAPGYDFNAAAISDLGVTAETALLFNGLLIAVGALNIVGGYVLYRAHARMWILALYVLGGIGAAGAGLVPLDRGALHSLLALFGFLFFNLEAIATGPILSGPMRVLSFLAGAVGLIFVGLMIVGDSGNAAAFGAIGHGGTERMIVYPAMLWLIAVGGSLMADRSGPSG